MFAKATILLFAAFVVSAGAIAQVTRVYRGTVIDTHTRKPIADAAVAVGDTSMRTDVRGQFAYSNYELSHQSNVDEGQIYLVGLYAIGGRKIGCFPDLAAAQECLARLPEAGYLLVSDYTSGLRRTLKCMPRSVAPMDARPAEKKRGSSLKSDSTVVALSKIGYYDQRWPLRQDWTYEMLAEEYQSVEFLSTIICPEAFALLQGPALIPKQSQIESVKIVYRLEDDSLFFINSSRYVYHYDFAKEVMGYKYSQDAFNIQYTDSPGREYVLATVNHYVSSDIWGLEFFPGDMVSCQQAEELYRAVTQSCYFGDSLRLVVNADRFGECTAVPAISQDEINAEQIYQPLNTCEGYGYLRKVAAGALGSTALTSRDIVLLDVVPLDIAPVSGIITAQFQTPLCHINVLSHNRGTPNMALRNAWQDSVLGSLEGKLIYLNVGLDTFSVRLADIAEAEAYWKAHEPAAPVSLVSDTSLTGLVGLDTCRLYQSAVIGGKAANFAELYRIKTNYPDLVLPEGAFAIPFSYYALHLRRNGIDSVIAAELADPLFLSDAAVRQLKLIHIQDLIKKAPIDTALLRMVKERIAGNGYGFTYYRFRSSTNTEDIEDFNGAGLYDSYTGSLTDPNKEIGRAIKKVWASLWNSGAYEERQYYRIDHRTVQMAILVHRSFPNETANGVSVSKIIYTRPGFYYPGITINTQFGEASITNPDGIYRPEELICYTFSLDPASEYVIEYLSKSDVPEMQGANVLARDEIVRIAKITQEIQLHFSMALMHYVDVDVEFKIDLVDGKRMLYIKQARPY